MDPQNIVSNLACTDGLPEEAIRASLAHPDDVVPEFLEILRKHAAGAPLSEVERNAIFLIIHILGELGETRAYRPLLDLLSLEGDQLRDILGDAITASLPGILISTFDGDMQSLHETIANPQLDEMVRHAAITAWTYRALTGEIDRDEAQRWLSEFPEKTEAPPESYVWASWAYAIANLGFEELTATVEKAFADGRIGGNELWLAPVTLDDFRAELKESQAAPDREQWMRRMQYWPFENTVDTLSMWSSFSDRPDDEEQHSDRSFRSPVPTVNPYRDVGRNDPCPCGSGKKYKKCCLQ